MSIITDVIGKTPLIVLQRMNKAGRVFIKLESRNPGGSIKDRAAYQMIKDLLDSNKINKDTMLIEPTSGNTGIGLCLICASMGLKLTIVMPESMSEERKKLMKAYGSTLVLTPAAEGVIGSCKRAEEIQKSTPNSLIVGQFDNKSNPLAHVLTTAPEIAEECKRLNIVPAYFLCGVGSGGTVTGCSCVLKKEFPDIKVVAFEPSQTHILRNGEHTPHKIQGVSPGFLPTVLDQKCYDEVAPVSQEDAYEMVRRLAREEGILVGISSAATIHLGIQLAEKHGCDVVCIASDSGERYLSVPGLFE